MKNIFDPMNLSLQNLLNKFASKNETKINTSSASVVITLINDSLNVWVMVKKNYNKGFFLSLFLLFHHFLYHSFFFYFHN